MRVVCNRPAEGAAPSSHDATLVEIVSGIPKQKKRNEEELLVTKGNRAASRVQMMGRRMRVDGGLPPLSQRHLQNGEKIACGRGGLLLSFPSCYSNLLAFRQAGAMLLGSRGRPQLTLGKRETA